MERASREGLSRRLAAGGALVLLLGCAPAPPLPAAVRLVDQIASPGVEITGTPTATAPPRAAWRFDRPTDAEAWRPGGGIDGLRVVDGRLRGTTATTSAILHTEWPDDGARRDRLHAVQIAVRVSAGTTLEIEFRGPGDLDLDAVRADQQWALSTPLLPGDELRTYELPAGDGRPSTAIRRVFVRPTDVAGATFEIASIRLIFDREQLAETPSGVAWRGLAGVFRETVVAKTPETIRVPLAVPDRAWLDLSLGTMTRTPTTFTVAALAEEADEPVPLLTRTVTTPDRWEPASIALDSLAGQRITLTFTVEADEPGVIGLWGAPAVRTRAPASAGGPPLGVILVMADTIRPDHLGVYGYGRPTTPTMNRLAAGGARFDDVVAQATWTKTSAPSILSSLYPLAHGVHDVADRLPSAAVTLAEAYRAAGYATTSFSSINFTGADANLHQGFETLHEASSRTGTQRGKSARQYVDRLLAWLESRPDAPFFALLHLFDPHPPYEPRAPYAAMWADAAGRAAHLERMRDVRGAIDDPFLRGQVMPTRSELDAAGVDVEAFLAYREAWYDGSIRGMDAELGRLVEWIETRGLDDRIVLAVVGDHGEEFLEHGRSWHGQSVYGELTRVPLLLWAPGRVAPGHTVAETVRTIDLMPTLLGLSGLPVPEAAQGQSLLPLLAPAGAPATEATGWIERPAVAEKHPRADDPDAAVALVLDGWRLVHTEGRGGVGDRYELYDERHDPLNQTDVAAEHPDTVTRLTRELDRWRRRTEVARLPADDDAGGVLSAEELDRLRSLGYIR